MNGARTKPNQLTDLSEWGTPDRIYATPRNRPKPKAKCRGAKGELRTRRRANINKTEQANCAYTPLANRKK